jgi:hypothetical protein
VSKRRCVVFKRQTGWGPHPPTHHQHNTARVRGHRSVSVFFFPVSVPSTSSRRIVCSIHRRSLRIHSSRRNAVYSRVESCRRTESDPLRLSLRSCAFVRPLRGAYRDDAIPRLFARKKSTLPPDPPSSSIDFSPLSSFHPYPYFSTRPVTTCAALAPPVRYPSPFHTIPKFGIDPVRSPTRNAHGARLPRGEPRWFWVCRSVVSLVSRTDCHTSTSIPFALFLCRLSVPFPSHLGVFLGAVQLQSR